MPIIQMLLAGSGRFTKSNFYTIAGAKPRVTVMPDGTFSLFTAEVSTRTISVEMWGGGGASGSTRYGNSGDGGPGGYISGVIPISQIGANILRLVVGGGGGATGGGEFNVAGSNDYYARPLDQFLEFNTSTIQHVASTSTSSNPTFSTITPITGSTVSSVSNVTYSTITPVAGATASSISSPTYNTITHVFSTSDTNVNSLTITPGLLALGDIILVSSVSATGQTPQDPPNNPTGYTVLETATVNGNVNYTLSYRRVTDVVADATITNLSNSINDDNGDPFLVAHTASVFRGAFGIGDPIAIVTTNNTASTSINPPAFQPETPNYMSVAFGFLSGGSTDPVDITDPTNYTRAVVQRVGTTVNAADEATTMVAYRSVPTSAQEDPQPFTVPVASSDSYVAITVGLMPTKTLSAISGSMTIPALAALQVNDVVLVSSVSDGGTMSTPTGFNSISTATGAAGRPAYNVSWKRLVAGDFNLDGSLTIGGLSTSGLIIGGQAAGQPAGVAHYATAFRNVSTTANPIFTASTGTPTGNPDSPLIPTTGDLSTANHAVLSFGFLNNRSLPTVTAPGGYTLLTNGVNTVGSDNLGTTEATSMVAYTNLTTTLSENPGAFTVTGSGAGANYVAVTVALTPVRTLSTISGSMSIPAGLGLAVNDVVLVSSVSDGGTMSTPTGFNSISSSSASPAYNVSWKRLVAGDFDPITGAVNINGLSLSGTTTGGLAAGVAHHATAFRGVDTTLASPFSFQTSTGTGNPDPPGVASLPISNYTAVVFGFLNNTALPTVSPPTAYNQLSTLTVSDSTPGTEATSMVAYRTSLGSGPLATNPDANPGPFSVTGVGGQNNAAVTVALRPSPVASGGDFSVLNLPTGLTENDLVIVSSVSDGGTMNIPTGYTLIESQIGVNSPSYQISYKRMSAVVDTQVTGLSPSGSTDGDGDVTTAGVAHVASVYRGVSLTTNPTFVAANGNGNPDPPQINGASSGDGVVAFGFLDDISITDASITAPTTPAPGYTKTVTRAVGSDNNGNNEATIMSAFKLLSATGNENPGSFSVTGNDGRSNSAVSIRLVPQVNARFSTVTGGCGGSGGGYSGIFLPDGTPLLIAGGGGGGGGGTTSPFLTSRGGSGGSGGGGSGQNGNLLVSDGVNFQLAGGGGLGGSSIAGGTGGSTLLGLSGTPTTGNAGEAGVIYDSALIGGFYSGGRGANSPYSDLVSLPLQGANATGGWNRGAGGGSSRTDSTAIAVQSPTDCGGGGGAGYYGGGGGGSGAGGGGGGGGGGSNYADPRVSVILSSTGVGLLPAVTALPPSGNYITGVGVGGAFVFSNGVDVPGNPGGNGLIILKYFV